MTRARDLADIIGPNGDLIVTGDLQVTGTTTTVNSTTVEIADNNILLGSGATTNTQNTGAGLSVLLPDASPDEFATLVYTTSSDSWGFNKDLDVTGTATATNFIANGDFFVNNTAATVTAGYLYSDSDDFIIRSFAQDKDIIFRGNEGGSVIEAMRIDMSAGGSVGIGTNGSPLYKLHVATNGTTELVAIRHTGSTNNPGLFIIPDEATGNTIIDASGTTGGLALVVRTGGVTAFKVTNAGNIEAPSASSGNFEIGIEDNATDTFRTSAKGLIIKGNDAFTGGSPQQASAGGDVEVRAGYGVDNTGLGTFAGDLTLSGGIPFSGNSSGAGQIFLKTNNTEVLTVSRNQKVGIGTTTPATPLTLKHSSTTDETGGFRIVDANDSVRANFYYNGSQSFIIHGASAPIGIDAPALQFATGGATPSVRMTILEEGNVGIGTISPDYRLDVEADEDTWIARIYNTGSDANAAGLLVRSEATAAHDASVMGVYADGGYKMLVKSTGNVGIGTTTPASLLNVYTDVGRDFRVDHGTPNRTILSTDRGMIIKAGAGYSLDLDTASTNGTIRFLDDGTAHSAFDATGNFGIGTISPNYKLEVNGSAMVGDPSAVTSPSFSAQQQIVKSFTYGSTGIGRGGNLYLLNTNTSGEAGFLAFGGYYNNTNNLYYQTGGIGGGKETSTGDETWGGYLSFWTTSDGTAGAASGQFEHMRITADGNVGIGTTNPGTKLNVDGAITHKELNSAFTGGGGANTNYFKIFSKNFSSSSSFATNSYRVSITLGGETGGKIGFAEFDVGFKQQGAGDYFEIVPFRSAYCDVGYTWDVNGGSESSGLLEIYINADNFYMYFDVQVQARGAPNSSLEGWECTDTGSGTPPAGMISMTFNQESKGIHYSQAGLDIEPIQLGAPFDRAQLDSGYYFTKSNPNGLVFTLQTATNGAATFLKLEGGDHVGYRSAYYRCHNVSGVWVVNASNIVTDGTAPTFTVANNSTANPTITLGFNTGYSGGFVMVTMGAGITVT